MDVDAVAGGHVDKVFQACAVLRCLVLLAGLDSRSKAFLGRRDLYPQLLDHRSSPRARGLTDGRGQEPDGPGSGSWIWPEGRGAVGWVGNAVSRMATPASRPAAVAAAWPSGGQSVRRDRRTST